MKNISGIVGMRWILINSYILLIIGCASTNVPGGWLPEIDKISTDGRGGWIDITYGNRQHLSGELISVQNDTLFLLNGEKLSFLRTTQIIRAKMAIVDVDNGLKLIRNFTLLGVASTISHGLFGFLTAPLWVVAGTWASAQYSNSSVYKFPSKLYSKIEYFSKYSRFPIGIPKNLDRSSIKSAVRSKYVGDRRSW